MLAAFDRKWKAAAAHLLGLGIRPEEVLAPAGFQTHLPGCSTAQDARGLAHMAALILHKGRLEQAPAEHLVFALDNFTLSFANEVFLVLTRTGEEISPDNPHRMERAQLLEKALLAHARQAQGKDAQGAKRAERAAAVYLGEKRVQLETAYGHVMLVDGDDIAIVPHLVRDGWFDRDLTDVIGSLLEPGMTFVDIGANFGTYTLIGAAQVGQQGRVIAVEPSPAIAALLSENVTVNGYAEHAKVLRCALGAEEGVQTLYEFATRKGSNTMLAQVAEEARAAYGEAITAIEVECRTLDAVIEAEAPERVDLIKIDVEGFEQQVLDGARATIARYRPRLIVEWHSDFFTDRPGAALALYDLLTKELGYRLRRIDADGKLRLIGFKDLLRHSHCDIVAEHEDAPDSIKALWS